MLLGLQRLLHALDYCLLVVNFMTDIVRHQYKTVNHHSGKKKNQLKNERITDLILLLIALW